MAGKRREPQQTVVEADGAGLVLAGPPRSIRLMLVDAIADPDVSEVYAVTVSGEPVMLQIRDEDGALIEWTVREAAW